MFRAGTNTANPPTSYVAQIYQMWCVMQVDPAAPLVPLFLPNLIIGTPAASAGLSPIGDPAVDVLHRDIVEIISPGALTCDSQCGADGVVSDPYEPRDNLDILWKDVSRPYLNARVRSKRFLKENQTLFLIQQIVVGAMPNTVSFFMNFSLFGHLALKVRW